MLHPQFFSCLKSCSALAYVPLLLCLSTLPFSLATAQLDSIPIVTCLRLHSLELNRPYLDILRLWESLV